MRSENGTGLSADVAGSLTSRAVRLPYDFGDIVFHRAKPDRVPGMVVGFVVVPGATKILVKWSDDLGQGEHFFLELSTEFDPPIT